MRSFERELRRQRAELLRMERRDAVELVDSYSDIYRRLKVQLRDVTDLIEREAAPKVSWLVRQRQYETLLDEVQREVWAYSRRATEVIGRGQRRAAGQVNANVRSLIELSYPASIAEGVVTSSFVGLNPGAISHVVGFASNGKPLGNLLAEIAPDAVQRIRGALEYGVATGQHPRVIAREFRKAASMPLDRALTISRTEVLRAYRTASLESFRANRTVTGWTWVASLSTRTCSACWAMHGSVHSDDEPMASHVRCRCSMAPRTLSPSELGFKDVPDSRPVFEPGSRVFDRLSAAEQRQILGPRRFDLYKDGQFRLQDTIHRDVSPEWGTQVRTASIKQTLANAA